MEADFLAGEFLFDDLKGETPLSCEFLENCFAVIISRISLGMTLFFSFYNFLISF